MTPEFHTPLVWFSDRLRERHVKANQTDFKRHFKNLIFRMILPTLRLSSRSFSLTPEEGTETGYDPSLIYNFEPGRLFRIPEYNTLTLSTM